MKNYETVLTNIPNFKMTLKSRKETDDNNKNNINIYLQKSYMFVRFYSV